MVKFDKVVLLVLIAAFMAQPVRAFDLKNKIPSRVLTFCVNNWGKVLTVVFCVGFLLKPSANKVNLLEKENKKLKQENCKLKKGVHKKIWSRIEKKYNALEEKLPQKFRKVLNTFLSQANFVQGHN